MYIDDQENQRREPNMPTMNDIGKRILMKHTPTGESHLGIVEDINDDGYIIYLDSTASMITESLLIDPRYDNWTVVKVIP